tara:strand:+ start:1369 stop:2400 length:1032 start_codon:yes stop_codon:yes gene_type:complete
MSKPKNHNLTDREAAILTAVIEGYIDNGMPVSSGFIKDSYELNVSPATIRNEMASLEEKGFLTHLHTSGGRVPTDIGYRFYISRLNSVHTMDIPLGNDMRNELLTISNNVDELLGVTADMLAKISSMFGVVAISGYQQSKLTDIELVPIQGDRIMFVLALDTGLVKSIVLNLDIHINSKRIQNITQLLKDRLIGLTLKEIQSTMNHRLNDAEMYDHELVQILINERYSYFTIDSNNKIYTSSTNVLLDQPEFQDLTFYQRVLPVLEKPFLNHHFKENFHLNSNNTLIGTENGDIRLEDCAIITTQFDSGMMQGRIGVIGPKRVPYFSLKALLEKFTEIVQSAI